MYSFSRPTNHNEISTQTSIVLVKYFGRRIVERLFMLSIRNLNEIIYEYF